MLTLEYGAQSTMEQTLTKGKQRSMLLTQWMQHPKATHLSPQIDPTGY